MSNSGVYLIESQYLPPIETLARLFPARSIRLEMMEHFIKASYRNRAVILGANGPLVLSIPIAGGRSQRRITGEIRIDNKLPWMHSHWMSIVSAYGRSPYFEHYKPDFEPIWLQEYDRLVDLNRRLLELLLPLCGMAADFEETTAYAAEPEGAIDLRNAVLRTKGAINPPASFEMPAYQQAFADRFSFVPNLSILDALFNLGPETGSYLERLSRQIVD